ncbi:glycoside hydrolase family 19 protein [Actinobacillus equuli]|uniref:glycoside hydrolase family 19 protein n=1 Tax=Actinobacillus equuli TaxID=718 RepID=UPI002440F5EE|nr:glycoside hydrolase, family 19 [Actinobacillus equuli]WGE86460.1 glycoside hydrolase, family 19 [Actinobacillus equuli subsp. haemolyticus]
MNDETHEFDTTSVEIMVPLSEVKKVTIGKEANKKDYYDVGAYLNNMPEKSEAKIYVDDTHLTHGILLPGVNVFSQTSNSLCIFKAELHEWCDPNSELSQVEKDQLDPMFSAILAELDLDKDKPTEFKAGKLNQISLSPSQHRRMTGLIAKHDNEWKTTRIKDFEKMLVLYRRHGKAEQASRLEKRIKDLAISLKVNYFDTEKPAYYMHPLGMVGWLKTESLLITPEMVNAVAPDKGSDKALLDALNKYAKQYEINTPLRIAHFLAQCAHESGGFRGTSEGIYYRKIAALGYKKFRDASLHIQNTICPPNAKYCKQPELFNLTYGGRLGNNTTGDGFLYRGRGYIQLTGKNNYKLFTEKHNLFYPDDIRNFVE